MTIWESSCTEPFLISGLEVPVPVPFVFVSGILCGVVLTLLVGLASRERRELSSYSINKISTNTSSNDFAQNEGDHWKQNKFKLELNETSQQKIGNNNSGENTNTATKNDTNMNAAAHDILQAAITLFEKQTRPSMKDSYSSAANNKVVEYLSPEEMLQQLFATDKNISLRLNMNLTNTNTNTNTAHQKVEQITECFRLIQKYSVNTNHPFFFNQLFGAVDPVALAAEMIALSVNTSAYTYETAPVFTMIERDVLGYLGRLVFNLDGGGEDHGNSGSCGNDSDTDGLMLPGGSLSNLTALHVARHYAKYGVEAKPSHCHRSQSQIRVDGDDDDDDDIHEEKKEQENDQSRNALRPLSNTLHVPTHPQPELVAFVSAEAHYSFIKAISVIGIESHNLIVVPTLHNGQMDVEELESLMINMHDLYGEAKVPFFVGVTAGSTVRGSFDDINAIVRVCRRHEEKMNSSNYPYGYVPNRNLRLSSTSNSIKKHKIWIHVDGAWGGSAIFSARHDIRGLVKGVEKADSFTFNPHKMLGAPQQTTAFVTRHKGLLKAANSSGAKYLFDCRKNGAEYDLGDASYTCGRRTDSIKLWALLKFHGPDGLGRQLEQKVDVLDYLVKKIKEKNNFLLACDPWPFNVNFFFVPEHLGTKMIQSGVDMDSSNPQIGEHLSKELADVSVRLKLVLHQNGEMMIPYQPISNQEADCFRIVLAGYKPFTEGDVDRVLELMEQYGNSL